MNPLTTLSTKPILAHLVILLGVLAMATHAKSLQEVYSPKHELRCLGATHPNGPFQGIDHFMQPIRDYGYNAVLVHGLDDGYAAVYPSKYFPLSKFRGYGPDTLKTIIETCHAEKVKVTVYCPYNMKTNDYRLTDAGPDYEPAEAQAKLATSMDTPFRDMFLGALREICALGPDGLWIDGFTLEHANLAGPRNRALAAVFARETGLSAPTGENWESDTFRRWVKWRYEHHLSHAQQIVQAIHEDYPHVHVSFNTHYTTPAVPAPSPQTAVGALSWHRWREAVPLRRLPGMLGTSTHAKLLPSNGAQYTPFWTALASDLNPLRNDLWQPAFAECFRIPWHYTWLRKGTNIPVDEICIRLSAFAAFTNRTQIWVEGFTTKGGAIDPGAYTRLNQALAQREAFFGGDKLKYCGLYLSHNTRDFWGLRYRRDSDPRNTDRLFAESYIGLVSMLMSDHIQFEHIFDNTLDAATLDQFAVVLLPNTACLSDKACTALSAYVQRGGRLIATYESSLYDEWGNQRSDFGLAELFGASYLKTVDRVAFEPHRWVRELADPSLNQGAKGFTWQTRRTLIRPAASARILAHETGHCAPAFDFPGKPSACAAIIENRVGKGECIYVVDDLSQGYYQAPFRTQRRILKNLIQRSPPPYSVSAPSVIVSNAYIREDQHRIIVHLLNLPPMSGRLFDRCQTDTLDDIVPVHDIKVTIRQPRALSARLIPAGIDLPMSKLPDGSQEVTVPRVQEHEMVCFKLGHP